MPLACCSTSTGPRAWPCCPEPRCRARPQQPSSGELTGSPQGTPRCAPWGDAGRAADGTRPALCRRSSTAVPPGLALPYSSLRFWSAPTTTPSAAVRQGPLGPQAHAASARKARKAARGPSGHFSVPGLQAQPRLTHTVAPPPLKARSWTLPPPLAARAASSMSDRLPYKVGECAPPARPGPAGLSPLRGERCRCGAAGPGRCGGGLR